MLTVLPTPPSMKRRSPIVTGGHAPGHRAAGGDRVDQPDTRIPVEHDQFARRGVDRGDPQHPRGPFVCEAAGAR